MSDPIVEKLREFLGAFCTERPPAVYCVEDDEGLRTWVETHKKREFRWIDTAELVRAADRISGACDARFARKPADDLAPCPFCGGATIRITKHDGFHLSFAVYEGEHVEHNFYADGAAHCRECAATMPVLDPRDAHDLDERWNQRAKKS